METYHRVLDVQVNRRLFRVHADLDGIVDCPG
jgi:hypothetical protein